MAEPDVLRNLTDLLDRVDYSMEMYDKMAMSYADEQGSAASSSSGSGTSGTDGDHDDDGGQGNSLVMSGLISTDAGDNAEFEAPEWPEGTNLDEERECPICLDDVALRDGMLLGCHDGSFYCNNVRKHAHAPIRSSALGALIMLPTTLLSRAHSVSPSTLRRASTMARC